MIIDGVVIHKINLYFVVVKQNQIRRNREKFR